ncbi:unnamed protein product [Rotaria sordida]|uniref:Transducer of regulated CREB activity N-terminal domain-containing protein n=1 Tax=Rotaria sordida TaxID=392033 RepID=A0A814T3L0_9BILA|nr:unnamed protein product [Rotaria sordida]CAF1156212.1 unnamed protein product [Rotaria sordida]CAF3604814.1 unnamed protein product [Rotaria sordida]CAF3700680.1 unnamed protein product [Rotaria sordida]
MSSPRKFAEKIALIQQKQAEGDAAFNTIIYEVEAAKQRADRVSSIKSKSDIPAQTYEIPNGINNSDSNNYVNQSIKIDNNNCSNRLLLPPDNSSWRRAHSDPSLHQTVMPTVITHYHAQLDNEDNNQQLNFDINDIKYEPTSYNNVHNQPSHHLQISNSQFQSQNYYDLNNNNYTNNETNIFYPSIQTLSVPQQTIIPSTTNNTILNTRYNNVNNNSNILMLPPNQHARNGGSLPDLRCGNVYNNNNNNNQQLSSTSMTQQFLRSPSPQQNSDGDLFVLGPQQQSPSRIGPLKPSPSIRRRHSPIGNVRQSSPRRQTSPSPDMSPTQQTFHRIEPQSPQSQSSYSPQNSPIFLQSPGNELPSYSSQQQQQQSTDNQNTYYTLPNHLDQITLDNNFYAQQQSSPPSSQQHNNSSSTTSNITNDLQQQRNFYSPFIDDMSSSSYCHNQPTNQRSPTIPNIILTDADSSKLDLSKELANDFSNSFDNLLDTTDLQINAEDFLLNMADLSVDPINCDDTFCMER